MKNGKQPAFNYSVGLSNHEVESLVGLTKREYFAGLAMQSAQSETTDVVPANFYNWCKMLLVEFLHLTFLEIKYKDVKGAKEATCKRAINYADELLKQLEQ